MYRTNRLCFAAVLLAATTAFCNLASGLQITSYFSPRNRERPRRPHTWYIILHTTEGPKKGSLNKVRKNGECHYVSFYFEHRRQVAPLVVAALRLACACIRRQQPLLCESFGFESKYSPRYMPKQQPITMTNGTHFRRWGTLSSRALRSARVHLV